MLEKLKTDFYGMIAGLGFNVSDNRKFDEGNSPWLILRTNGYEKTHSFQLDVARIILVLDIFSKYNGEREIIQAIEKIADNLNDFLFQHPDILYCQQKNVKILDDKLTGPVRKHGVITYEFLLSENKTVEEDVENE